MSRSSVRLRHLKRAALAVVAEPLPELSVPDAVVGGFGCCSMVLVVRSLSEIRGEKKVCNAKSDNQWHANKADDAKIACWKLRAGPEAPDVQVLLEVQHH
jgi:hypothetical protein